ncbi:hypothetical protein [Salinarimonas rosea]|uniref:hypothetical protein n=1 Tax=Salinarimonas rosea TaxID=552063 RepID=UPI00048CEC8D|nr:hypothetical protein [Salinarimonas rosea]
MPSSEAKGGPELVFCLCAPVGSGLDAVQAEFTEQLRHVGYEAVHIHITDLLPVLRTSSPSVEAAEG